MRVANKLLNCLHFSRMPAAGCAWLLALNFALFAMASGAQGDNRPTEQSRPNIILFLVDDLGWQDTSVPFWKERTAFQHHFRTPHVQRLAQQGIRFTAAYSCAVCSPTRTSILTGQNAARHGVTNWTLWADRDQSGRTNRLGPPPQWRKQGWQPDAVTLPKVLKTAGYATIHCGKAPWGARETAGSDPRNLGFDVNIAGHAAGAPGSYLARENFGNRPDGSPKPPWGVPGLEKYHGTDMHLTDVLAIEACVAIRKAVADDQPFFLYMAPYAVHTPIQPQPRFIDNYRGRKYPGTDIDIPNVESDYASMVEGYDAALGKILNQIDELGVADETLIVFTSDNGGLSAHARSTTPRGTGRDTHCWPLREGKGSAYEGGTRVPLVVSWARPDPDSPAQAFLKIESGSASEVPVICEDYFPSICRWANIDVTPFLASGPNASQRNIAAEASNNLSELFGAHVIDGEDITPYVLGNPRNRRRPLIFHYPHVWGPRGAGYQPHSAMRWGDAKIVHFYHSNRFELYDLQQDIGETDDRSFRDPQLLKLLSEMMASELKRLGHQRPVRLHPGDLISSELGGHDTVNPLPSDEDRAAAAGWLSGGTWLDQHQAINAIASEGKADIVFLGDSITQSWGGSGRKVAAVGQATWDRLFQKRNAANFGISGDRTQHVLWRIQNGNLDGIQPKMIVLLIGTNNLAHDTAPQIAHGIEQIVMRIEERRDRTKILVLGILPRGPTPNDPLRQKAAAVNRLIQRLDDGNKTTVLDLSKYFLTTGGGLTADCFTGDHLHLTAQGYAALGDAIEPVLVKMIDP